MYMYPDESDEALRETGKYKQWKKEAKQYWERWLPKWSAELKKQKKFEETLDRHVLDALKLYNRAYHDLTERPEVKNEPDFLERVGRIKAASYMAEELAKTTWLFLPPEPGTE